MRIRLPWVPVARSSAPRPPQRLLSLLRFQWQQWIWAKKWAMKKPKSFRPWQPEQTTLLPPSPREWLSPDHQVYVMLDLVDELDLSEILIPAQAKDPRGEKGFDPRM